MKQRNAVAKMMATRSGSGAHKKPTSMQIERLDNAMINPPLLPSYALQ